MRAIARNTFTAVLILGATVFAWPTQALQCPKHLFWRTNMPIDEAYERMAKFAEKKIAEAQSIFRGRIIKVEFAGPDTEYPLLVLTYEIDEWFKGSGQRHARIVYEGWCDGGCANIVKMMDGLQHDDGDAIYIAAHADSQAMKNIPNLPREIDGVFGLCSRTGRSIEPINKPDPYSRLPHRHFLLQLTLVNEVEKLSSEPRRNP